MLRLFPYSPVDQGILIRIQTGLDTSQIRTIVRLHLVLTLEAVPDKTPPSAVPLLRLFQTSH